MANHGHSARRISIAALVDHPTERPQEHVAPVTPASATAQQSQASEGHQSQHEYSSQGHLQQHQISRAPTYHQHSSSHPSFITVNPSEAQSHQSQMNPPNRQQVYPPPRATPHPQVQPHSQVEHESQFSPSNRRDISSTTRPIEFEFYDPNDSKKSRSHQHRASVSRKGDVSYMFVNDASGPGTGSIPTDSNAAPPAPSVGKPKKERTKSKSISGVSNSAAIPTAKATKPRKQAASKKSQGNSQTSGDFSAVPPLLVDDYADYRDTNTASQSNNRRNIANLMNAVPPPSDHPTPASDRQSVAPSATPGPEPSPGTEAASSPPASIAEHVWPAPTELGTSQILADTTVDDDIMADLDMAENNTRNSYEIPSPQPPTHLPDHRPSSAASMSSTAVQSMTKKDDTSRMEIESDLLEGFSSHSPSKSPQPPHLKPIAAAHKSGSRSSMASLSPNPPSMTPARTPSVPPVLPATSTTKKVASKAAAKPKAKAPARKKAETGKARGGASKGDGDWTWGTSSGRAAAVAAANAFSGDPYGARDSVPPTVHIEEPPEEEEEEDLRLYCVCRERYDNRFMLGCDNCDEWFHPPCLGMEDFQCDLLEHFYCGSCRKADPSLKTTWRVRCANGQQHPYPDTADACWKAALPPLSKYCSIECGMDAMERRIAPIVRPNGSVPSEGELLIPRSPVVKNGMSKLWAVVKDGKKRDAVVVNARDAAYANGGSQTTTGIQPSTQVISPVSATQTQPTELEKISRQLLGLATELEHLAAESHLRSRELEFILARGRLARLAIQWSDKEENKQSCCFDSRLLLEGSEWEEWVEGVGRAELEGTMEATIGRAPSGQGNLNAFKSDGNGRGTPDLSTHGDDPEEELELEVADSPWCDGRRKCERHWGWQKLFLNEFELNKGTKELAIQSLAVKQREVQAETQRVEAQLQAARAARMDQDDNTKMDLASPGPVATEPAVVVTQT